MAQAPPPASPDQILMQLATGRWVSQAISLVADLAIPDLLAGGPRAVGELAASRSVHADALYRLLRAAAALGVLTELPDRRFANNDVSELMRSEVPGSLRGMVRWLNEASAYQAWGALDYSVRTSRPAFDHVHGVYLFDYFQAHPEAGGIFNDAMTSFSAITGGAVARAYDFSAFGRIVDVGGGHGALLAAIAERHPSIRGVVFDRPEVVGGAAQAIAARGLSGRLEAEAGSFMDGVPAGADAYLLKHIIHDWDDERSTVILANCRRAMHPAGKVLIVEQLVSDRPEGLFSKLADLEMLVMTPGGRERSEREFAALLQGAGLRMTRIVPTESIVVIVEAELP